MPEKVKITPTKKQRSQRALSIGIVLVFPLIHAATALGQRPVAFSSFHYRGNDSVLQYRSLKQDEVVNPILAGMYPDPSIVRVGKDYYLVNSTFAWYPGVPIFHSNDLVTWQQIGFVLDRPSQLDLRHLQISQGIFAPTLRYKDGMFYVITTLVGGIGTFYVTARNPAGPWSDPIRICDLDGIDPSFFFDEDGSTYIVHNARPPGTPLYDEQRVIWLVPFDLERGKISGDPKLLVNGGPNLDEKPRWIEGPHIFKRQGYYYLFAALGGTAFDHEEVVFRSTSVSGPYVPDPKNPLLTQRGLPENRPDPIGATGHADMVETPRGDWWAVFLGVRPYAPNMYNTGRETYLLPVSWKDGWPTMLGSGEAVPNIYKAPMLTISKNDYVARGRSAIWSDAFDEEALSLEWQTLRTSKTPCWKVLAQRHQLLLFPSRDDLASRDHPCLLARRQKDNDFSASIDIHSDSIDVHTDAGLAIFQNEHSFFFMGVTTEPGHMCRIFVQRGAGSAETPTQFDVTDTSVHHCTGKLRLRIEEKGASLSFSYQKPFGSRKILLPHADATVLSTAKAGGFVGTFIGPFARLQRR